MLKKKSLGQHFLTSSHYLSLIAETADIKPGEFILEIGPGDGALTQELLKKGAHVVAVEKDHRLIPILKEKFANENFTIIEADVLRLDISSYLPTDKKYKLVGNIPYYITGAILKKFLSEDMQPNSMTLLVQKEVAERIARSKKESILSLSVKAYGEPRYIKTVPSGAFSPPPSVDSAILHISHVSREHFTNKKEDLFFKLIKSGFAQKRKLLKRNLEPILGNSIAQCLAEAQIAENARAEDVPLQKWLALTEIAAKNP